MHLITKYLIEGLLQISPPMFEDERGFFKEIVRFNEIEKAIGKSFLPKQANHSRSIKNTLRGIHVAPWDKIIYVTKGEVQVAVVDCRKDSPTFGKHESIILNDNNKSCIFVPAHFGNSYLVLSDEADYIYLASEEWAPNKERDIIWNDETLNIKWNLNTKPFLSVRDKNGLPFSTIDSNIK